MSEDTVQLFINDQEVTAPKGAMLIEITDRHNVDVPRFCYHKKLSVAANCRMCMVEVENAPKPLPACATPVAEGMKVYTKSTVALDAQKGTMEFLLINHPLDCPVCDQGGECELQDIAMGYGKGVSRYIERKRVVADKDLGPLVSTDMTRCIHCTRCVRFGDEIAGVREMGATGRGEFMEIGTYVELSLSSELSGNVIDICPVGALNAKPSRMTARSWEMLQTASIAPHDGVGSNIYLHQLRNQVMRVVPRENEEVNETWISDRDRFSYEGLNASDRVTQPMFKDDKTWVTTEWNTCLEKLASKLNQYSAEQIGVLAAPHSSIEELYLLQNVFRRLGVQNIDHRTRQIDFTDQAVMPLFPNLGQSIEDLENSEAIFLVGCDIRLEQPMLAHRMRKSACEVIALNSQIFEFYFANQSCWNLAPQHWITALAEIAKCAGSTDNLSRDLIKIIESVEITHQAQKIFDTLKNSNRATILLGAMAEAHPQASAIRALSNFIAQACGISFGMIALSGNSAGAWLSGVVPHRLPAGKSNANAGMDVVQMIDQPRQVYVLFNLEPEFDFSNMPAATEAMQQADFVIIFTPYFSDDMREYADVILPIATFAEADGTYVNTEGRWQSISKAVPAPGEVRSGWRVLRVLANKLGFEDMQYQTSQEVRDELKALCENINNFDSNLIDYKSVNLNGSNVDSGNADLYRVSSTPIYSVDNIVRRAESLQATVHAQQPYVSICSQQAKELGIDKSKEKSVCILQGENAITLPLFINDKLPMQCVWIEKSLLELDELGDAISPVELQRVPRA